MAQFTDEWFAKIRDVVNEKGAHQAQVYYTHLQPNLESSLEENARFEEFFKTMKAVPESERRDCDARLEKWLTQTIAKGTERYEARQLSLQWLESKNAKL